MRRIGTERFGVLSLAWIVLGYVGVLDLGLGRALTQLVAQRIGGPEENRIPRLAWTSLLLLFLLGFLGALITCAISPWLVHKALKIPASLQTETLQGFFLLGASVPITMLTSGLRGLLEALQRFRLLSLIRIAMAIFSFGGPLLVLPFSRSLVPIFTVLIAGRIMGCIAHGIACFRVMPALRKSLGFDFHHTAALFKFGGWLTAANLAGQAVNYVDRFLIGGLLSLTAVAFYTTPFDMLTRLWVIPAALISVLFPAFSVTFEHDPGRAGLLLARGVKYVLMSIFPLVLIIVTLSREILGVWLGPVFAQNSAPVLRLLAAGIFLNCLAQVPFTFIQGAGRPDIITKMTFVQFPLYLVAAWLMILNFGITGAAIAWTTRAALEACFFFLCAVRLLPQLPAFLSRLFIASGAGLLALYLATFLGDEALKACFLVVVLFGFAFACWHWGLRPGERVFFTASFDRVVGRIRGR